jgi:hypothetical protein
VLISRSTAEVSRRPSMGAFARGGEYYTMVNKLA